ncbi:MULTISPECIES: hypothetical protein [Microbacterium]|uniref:hypothetical protein n=1 Tax=Microbacterium TaxID=33882 RepID=UPI0027D8688C|nr:MULTISPECIES: hypothetical protein [Microbacterium]
MALSTAVPAHADVLPAPEATEEVVDQPEPPAGSEPSTEPSVPEGTFDPAPTEPVPTEVPTVPPAAPVGTAQFEPNRPADTVVEPFRSENATSTSGGTGAESPRNTAPAPRVVEPATEPTETATASPSPVTPTASPTPVTARGGSADSGTAVRSISAPKAPTPPLPILVIGLAVLIGGLVIVRYRDSVWKAAARAIPGGAGARVERLHGAFRVGVAGAVVALVGVTMNGYAAWQLWGALSS